MEDKKSLVIKVLLTLFVVGFLVFISTRDRAADVSAEKIAESFEKTSAGQMPKRDKGDLKRYYSIEDTETEGYVFYKDASPMSVNEVLIVKASSKDKALSYLEACKNHLENQKNVFGSYGTDQMALLGKAVVECHGNYACYICGPDASSWSKTFMEVIR